MKGAYIWEVNKYTALMISLCRITHPFFLLPDCSPLIISRTQVISKNPAAKVIANNGNLTQRVKRGGNTNNDFLGHILTFTKIGNFIYVRMSA